MARKRKNPMTTTVEISCDRYDVCCARSVSSRKAVRGEVCGMSYKFPWDHFDITRRQRKEIDSGWRVRKRVGYWSWQDMLSAWGEGGGLFGRAR